MLLIADEVITAFGRLGPWFGSDVFGIEPDLITVAKGLTSGYMPLSGCIVSERIWRVLVDGSTSGPFGHGYTYSAHPLAAAVAMTNLDLIEREGLVARAEARGALMHRLLRDAFTDHPLVGEIRGMALIGALEFTPQKDPARPFDPSHKVGARVARALPRARPDHACAARRGHDLVLAPVRDHRGRGRRPRPHRATRRRRGRRRASREGLLA